MKTVRITRLYHTGTRQLAPGDHDLTAEELERAERFNVVSKGAEDADPAPSSQPEAQEQAQETDPTAPKRTTTRRKRGK